MDAMTVPDVWSGQDRALTVEDMENIPDEEFRYELDDGMLIVSPVPSTLHQFAVARLTVLRSAACPAGLVVLPGVGVNISKFQHRVPDVAVVRAGSLESFFQETPPELVVEVASARTRLYDRNRKKDFPAGLVVFDPLRRCVRTGVPRSRCWAPSSVLALACRLNPAPRSSRPAVGADTGRPCRVSSVARCRSDLVVHRSGDSGSPRSSGSTNASNAGTSPASISPALLRPPAPPPGPAIRERILAFLSARRHRSGRWSRSPPPPGRHAGRLRRRERRHPLRPARHGRDPDPRPGPASLCRAVCPDLADRTISLKEITAARNARRRDLRAPAGRAGPGVVDRLIGVHRPAPPGVPAPAEQPPAPPERPRLKRYREE